MSPDAASSNQFAVTEEIRRYCSAHPGARDTIDGIVWWVQLQRDEDMKARVADAVRLLVEQGALQRFRLQDGTEVFGCGAPRIAEHHNPSRA